MVRGLYTLRTMPGAYQALNVSHTQEDGPAGRYLFVVDIGVTHGSSLIESHAEN